MSDLRWPTCRSAFQRHRHGHRHSHYRRRVLNVQRKDLLLQRLERQLHFSISSFSGELDSTSGSLGNTKDSILQCTWDARQET